MTTTDPITEPTTHPGTHPATGVARLLPAMRAEQTPAPTPDNVLAAVLQAAGDCRPGQAPPQPQTTFAAYGLDSLDRVTLAVAVEGATGLQIPDDILCAATTAADLTAAILTTTPAHPAPATAVQATAARAHAETAPAGVHAGKDAAAAGAGLGWIDPAGRAGPGTRLWHQAQIASHADVGADCTLGKGAYVGSGSRVGDRVKIGNYASVFGAHIGDDAMISPAALLLEDPFPRASSNGALKGPEDFTRHPVTVGAGATIGAGALVLPGVDVGPHAMVAAGAVVTHDVPAHGLVAGSPARQCGWACHCGRTLQPQPDGTLTCPACRHQYRHATPDADPTGPADATHRGRTTLVRLGDRA